MYFDRRLWEFTKGLRGRMGLSVLMGLLALAAGIARFAFLGRLLALVWQGAPWQTWLMPIGGAVVSILLRARFDHARTMMAHRTAARVQETLRGKLFDRIVALGPAWFAAQRTGGVMLSVVDGVEQLQTFFGQYLPQLAVAICAPVAIFGFIAFWDLPVAAVLLAGALLALFGPMAVHMRERRTSMARSHAFEAFGEEFLDGVQGLPTLKAFGQSRTWGERLAQRARAVSDNTFWVLAAGLLTRGLVDLGAAAGAAAALILGAWRVTQGEMSLTALLIVLMAGTEIFRPLRDLRSVLHQGMLGQSAAAGILDLLDATSTTPVSGSVCADELESTLVFENVGFSYAGDRGETHRGLNFSIASGERVGIVGPSGAGKSSIVRLVLRQHDPQVGRIMLGGQDLRLLDQESLHAKIAVVAQDSTLFHGSVSENLRLGRPDATDEQVRDAAQAAYAHDFIMALPNGYDALIGERGAQLSGGQRQRLAIARALLRDAPILILDEALSSVDAANEALIQKALDRLMQGRTTLILAHRLSSVIDADRILVLDHGKVVQSGPHAKLMAQPGLYRELMASQTAPAHIAATAVVLPLNNACAVTTPEPRDEDPTASSAEPSTPLQTPLSITPDDDPTGIEPRTIDADARELGWRETLGSLMSVIRPWRLTLIATVFLGVARVAAFIGVGAMGAMMLADVRADASYMGWMIALVIAAPLAAVLHWLESWLAHDMAYRLLADMRINLYDKLDALAPAYLLRRRAGDLVTLATQDVETVEYFYAHTVAPAFVAVLVPVSVLAVLGLSAWPLAIVLLPFLAYAMMAPIRGRTRIDRLGGQARAALGQLGAHMTETIQGLSDLQAFQATGRRRTDFIELARRYSRDRLTLLSDLSRQTVLLEAATGLGGLAVAVTGAWLVIAGNLASGLLPLLVLIAVAAFMPVAEISQVSRQLADTIASARRLRVVHDEPILIRDGPIVPSAKRGGSDVVFENVGFTYPGRTRPALTRVSFRIAAGTTAALVGASGAGKSTIANLLLRFWDPEEGSVQIDGADLRGWRLDALRGCVAMVSQDTYLFNDTLEANIRVARPDATEAQLALALKQAALTDFVATLPAGLATPVGERGVQLSGGQRQRIAIARAFLKDASVLVLDEATSHLDAISEAQVKRALDTLITGRTTLMIAHRLATIRNADTILVLNDGQVIEAGSHSELLGRGSAYAQLIFRQSGATGARGLDSAPV
jgi:ATP-binding cassette subfamily B protein